MAYRRSTNATFNLQLRKHLAQIREQNEQALVPRPDTCTKVCDEVEDKNFLMRIVNFFRRTS
jgi:hypothetical protein